MKIRFRNVRGRKEVSIWYGREGRRARPCMCENVNRWERKESRRGRLRERKGERRKGDDAIR